MKQCPLSASSGDSIVAGDCNFPSDVTEIQMLWRLLAAIQLLMLQPISARSAFVGVRAVAFLTISLCGSTASPQFPCMLHRPRQALTSAMRKCIATQPCSQDACFWWIQGLWYSYVKLHACPIALALSLLTQDEQPLMPSTQPYGMHGTAVCCNMQLR